jgi:hypothetical protein
MNVIKFLKENKSVFKWGFIFALSAVVYVVLHKIATSQRAYDAIGGEIFMFLIPFFVWIAPEIKKSIKEFKDVLSR